MWIVLHASLTLLLIRQLQTAAGRKKVHALVTTLITAPQTSLPSTKRKEGNEKTEAKLQLRLYWRRSVPFHTYVDKKCSKKPTKKKNRTEKSVKSNSARSVIKLFDVRADSTEKRHV
jgi:hypothetical protein